MNQEPSAVSLFAEGLARIADGVGVGLLILLVWRMFFVFDPALQEPALVVGLIGMAACWMDKGALKNAPLAMLAYTGVALLSAAVHRWAIVSSSADHAWLSLFTPASYLVVMAVFVYGTAHLLRTPARLSGFTVLLLGSIVVLSAQIVFDRAGSGFEYTRGGQNLPSIPHWGGIHGTSLYLTLGLPLASVGLVTGRFVWRGMASATLAAGLLVTAYLNGSRGGLVSMGLVVGAMAVFAVVRTTSSRRRPLLMGIGVAVLSIGLGTLIWSLRGYLDHGENFSGRTLMWTVAAKLVRDHPWLGVGPGNYSQAFVASGYGADIPSYYVGQQNAHNLFLHVSVEAGVFAMLCLSVFMLWALRACWRTWTSGHTPMVALGMLFALGGFLAHSLSQNFFDARAEVERTRLVVWMILAAILALERLPRSVRS